MPLDAYRAKRNFATSPEPSGERAPHRHGGGPFFCVQKHLASHLHYDFRLEHNGVLLSWAVPKGPTLDPTIKRFATQVEDHPLDYGEFEGVIPEGYGAGIVMLWDKGTWQPEVADIDGALAKGDLKFRLDGFKLKGSWVLVRTRGGPGGDRANWLLIKHRDEWAGPVDVAEAFPHSVKSGGDFADILSQNRPEIWVSNRPARGGQAGEMFARIVERALAMREGDGGRAATTRTGRQRGATTPARKSAGSRASAASAAGPGAVKTARARRPRTTKDKEAPAAQPRAKRASRGPKAT